jgi:hypothetical protein
VRIAVVVSALTVTFQKTGGLREALEMPEESLISLFFKAIGTSWALA